MFWAIKTSFYFSQWTLLTWDKLYQFLILFGNGIAEKASKTVNSIDFALIKVWFLCYFVIFPHFLVNNYRIFRDLSRRRWLLFSIVNNYVTFLLLLFYLYLFCNLSFCLYRRILPQLHIVSCTDDKLHLLRSPIRSVKT